MIIIMVSLITTEVLIIHCPYYQFTIDIITAQVSGTGLELRV